MSSFKLEEKNIQNTHLKCLFWGNT